MDEEWKEISGYGGLYDISNLGRVRSWNRFGYVTDGVRRSSTPHLLKANKSRNYFRVSLTCDGDKKEYDIHSLVMEYFGPPQPEGHIVLHGDGDASNNRITNLRWGTYKENHDDSKIHGSYSHGEKHGCAKLTEKEVREIREKCEDFSGYPELAEEYGVKPVTIWKIVRRKTWKHI